MKFGLILLLTVLGCLNPWLVSEARADVAPSVNGPVPLSIVVSNNSLVCSWPVLNGNWQLEKQDLASTQWLAIPADDYKTNGYKVSVLLEIPGKTTLFRVKRAPFAFKGRPKSTPLPPAPPALPENSRRPRLRKPDSQSPPPPGP